MTEAEGQRQGRKLLTAVERIIADTDSLIALSEEHLSRARALELESEEATLKAAAHEVVQHFARRSAITGGLAATPSLLPGLGSLVASVGGTLADICLVLKFEVELALVLSRLHGFDITRPEERQLALLMASVSTYDAQSGGNFLKEVAHASGDALWSYAPREASKLVVKVMAMIALVYLSKGWLLKALPVVGIAVGSSMNLALTRRVGARCIRELHTRRRLMEEQDLADEEAPQKARARKPSKSKAGTRARKPRKAG